MSALLSFFATIFWALVWLIALVVIAAIVLFFANRPLFTKWLKSVETFVYSDKEKVNSVGKGSNQPRRAQSSSTHEDGSLNDRLRQIQIQIDDLAQYLKIATEKNDDAMSQLRSQLMIFQNELLNLKKSSISQETHHQKHETVFSVPQKHFAYAPTSVSPYGFAKDDWQAHENGQIFVMTQSSGTEASFSINDHCPDANILNSLAYYSRLVDYDDYTNGGNASRIEVLEKGCLRLVSGVWTIESKIKIRLL